MSNKTSEEQLEAAIEQALQEARKDGQSTIKVKDGRFFFFSKAHLQKLLNALPEEKEELAIWVQERVLN